MTTPTTTREADAYLAEVRGYLDDLREEERAELLQDLAQHLADVTTDEDNSESDVREVLGSPAAYAADLRSAAGLPPRPSVSDAEVRPAFSDRFTPLLNHRWVAPIRRFLAELAPAWWVLRGYLVAVVPFWIDAFGSSAEDFPVPHYGGFPQLGALAVILGVLGSVLLGRWGRGNRQLGRAAGLMTLNLLVVLAALTAYSSIRGQYALLTATRLAEVSQLSQQIGAMSTSLESPYGTVTNIYPYDSQGNPLENVLLFDQDGRPLRSGTQEWWTDGCRRQNPLSASCRRRPGGVQLPLQVRGCHGRWARVHSVRDLLVAAPAGGPDSAPTAQALSSGPASASALTEQVLVDQIRHGDRAFRAEGDRPVIGVGDYPEVGDVGARYELLG